MNKEWIPVHEDNPIIKDDWRHSPDVELKMPDGKEIIGYYHIGGPDIPVGFRQILDGMVIDEIILPTHWRYINLNPMKERILTKEEQILVLETQIKERALIIYVLQSDLMDNNYPKPYTLALKDEIRNHKYCIQDYKKSLKELKKKK